MVGAMTLIGGQESVESCLVARYPEGFHVQFSIRLRLRDDTQDSPARWPSCSRPRSDSSIHLFPKCSGAACAITWLVGMVITLSSFWTFHLSTTRTSGATSLKDWSGTSAFVNSPISLRSHPLCCWFASFLLATQMARRLSRWQSSTKRFKFENLRLMVSRA